MNRMDGRRANELRPLKIVCGTNPYAEGSAEISCGATKVLITASVETEVPPWMDPAKGGWITAEYGMLPRATHTRNKREAAHGKQSGRTLEIQRLIGRALRTALDLKSIPGLTIKLDCDVISADGGTRTAAISGGWVALAQAISWAKSKGFVSPDYALRQVAAISVGMLSDAALLDLCYEEDSTADFDMNVVLDERLRIIEVQGTAERKTLDTESFSALLALATAGIRQIMDIQQKAAAA